MGNLVLWETLLFNPLAGFIIARQLIRHPKIKAWPTLPRFALALAACGLLYQSGRSLITIATGLAPRDDELIGWVMKDIGWQVLALSIMLYYAPISIKRIPKLNFWRSNSSEKDVK